MSVTVNLPAVLARLADNARVIESPAPSSQRVGDVIEEIVTRYPGLAPRLRDARGEPYAFVTFYLNDDDIRFNGGFGDTVRDGDEVTIVPAIAGG